MCRGFFVSRALERAKNIRVIREGVSGIVTVICYDKAQCVTMRVMRESGGQDHQCRDIEVSGHDT